jgi:hypothetical protein
MTFLLGTWLQASKRKAAMVAPTHRGVKCNRPQRIVPRLEILEDRTLPASLVVTSAADPVGPLVAGTLRYAVNQANQDAIAGQSDTITFDSAQMGTSTVTLLQGELVLSVSGAAVPVGTETIDGAGVVHVSGNQEGRVFEVDPGVQATLTSLTIQDGSVPFAVGGGIANIGTLTVSNATVSGNSAKFGGGIFNGGTLTVNNATLSGNSAELFGGGIVNSATAAIANTVTLIVSNTTLSGNSAGYAGGGIFNKSDSPTAHATLTLTNCTLSGNSAVGADLNGIHLSGAGGGIANQGGTATVSNSTLSGNNADGAIFGAGIFNGAPATATDPNSLFTLESTIVAANTGVDVYQGSVDGGSTDNLIGDGTSSGLTDGVNGNQVGSAASPINPLLAPLANYGGPTQTMALLPGSPALGRGAAAGPGVPTTDQRGLPRPTAGRVDVGAFQSQGFNLTPVFSALLSPSIVYGNVTIALTGHLASGGFHPPAGETVSVTVNGVTQTAALDAGGNFSSSFTTLALGVAGSPYTVTYSYSGDGVYNAANGSSTLTVTKKALTVTANDMTKIAGEANPAFTVSYMDFVPGEGPGDLSGALTFSTPATIGSAPGTYAIVPSGLTSGNYNITFVSGTLTVLSVSQATTNLEAQVNAAGLAPGLRNALDSRLQAAIDSLNRGNASAAVNQLQAFEEQVRAQRGKMIDAAQADALIAYAQGIINVVG